MCVCAWITCTVYSLDIVCRGRGEDVSVCSAQLCLTGYTVSLSILQIVYDWEGNYRQEVKSVCQKIINLFL